MGRSIPARFFLLLKLGFRNTLRNPRRSLLTLLAIATGVLSSCMLAALARGLTEQMIDDSIDLLTGHVQIRHTDYRNDPVIQNSFNLSEEQFSAVRDDSRVVAAARRLRVPGVINSERDSVGVTVVGTSIEAERGLSFIADAPIRGRALNGEDESGIILGERLIQKLETKVGRRVVLMSQGTGGSIRDRGFRIVGAFRTELESSELRFAFTGIDTLATMLGTDSSGTSGQISELSLRLKDREMIPGMLEELQATLPDLKITSWDELEPLVNALIKVQSGFLIIWFIIVIVTISFGLVNTLFMAIFERKREIAMLQALGMKRADIVLQILLESTVLLCIGLLVGNAMSLAGVGLLSEGIDLSRFSEGTSRFGLRSIVIPVLEAPDVLLVNLFALIISVLASLYPAWKAGQVAPAEALSN